MIYRSRLLEPSERFSIIPIFIDGDACPVKDEVMKVAQRHDILVFLVSNQWLRLPVDQPLLKKVLVSEGPDVADDWIVAHSGPGDVVVTADIPLAARCVDNKARVLSPTGKSFAEDSIGMTLAVRNLMTGLRETGEMTSHVPSFTAKDRSRFLSALETTLQSIRREMQT